MRSRRIIGRVVTASLVIMLAACSGNGSQLSTTQSSTARVTIEGSSLDRTSDRRSVIPPSLRSRVQHGAYPNWMKFGGDPAPEAGYVYVSEFYSNTINEYRANNQNNAAPICEITGPDGPQGIKVDRIGDLYTTYALGVATFGPNCGTPGVAYTDPIDDSDDVAIDGTTLYVSNLGDTGLTVSIYVYTLGDPNPLYQLFDLSALYPTALVGLGLAVDSHHNLFWSVTSQEFNNGFVLEFPHDHDGLGPAFILNATKIGTDSPGGILFDRADNLLLIDQNSRSIYIYAPPYNAPAFSTISLKGTSLYCAMGLNERRLYCLDYEVGSVDIYAYPSGTYIDSFTNGISRLDDPEGIAVQAACPAMSRAKCGE